MSNMITAEYDSNTDQYFDPVRGGVAATPGEVVDADTKFGSLGRSKLKRSNHMVFAPFGQFQSVATSTTSTSGYQMTVPHFDRIAVGIFNSSPNALTGVRAAFGVSNLLGDGNSVASITPSNGWNNLLFTGVQDATLPIGTLILPSLTVSDYYDKSSIAATDTPWAVLHLRLEKQAGSGAAMTTNVVSQSIESVTDGHVFRRRRDDAAAVTTPALGVSTATYTGGHLCFCLFLKTRNAGITIMPVGDSISETMYSYVWNWARLNSTPTNPITVCGASCISGSVIDDYTARMISLISTVKPSAVVFSGWSVNTVGGTVSQAALDTMWKNIAKAKQICEDNSAAIIITTGSPCNTNVYDWSGAEDALRLSFVSQLKANTNSSAKQFIMDSNAAWSGVTNLSGQVQYVAGATADGLHPNGTGQALNNIPFSSVMLLADA